MLSLISAAMRLERAAIVPLAGCDEQPNAFCWSELEHRVAVTAQDEPIEL